MLKLSRSGRGSSGSSPGAPWAARSQTLPPSFSPNLMISWGAWPPSLPSLARLSVPWRQSPVLLGGQEPFGPGCVGRELEGRGGGWYVESRSRLSTLCGKDSPCGLQLWRIWSVGGSGPGSKGHPYPLPVTQNQTPGYSQESAPGSQIWGWR